MGTYTNKKVKIIGSCNLYIIHPDTRCVEEIPFFVASNEGSILISCATSLALDHPTPEGNRNVIYSSADKLKKKDESRLKVCMLIQKNKIKTSAEKISDMCSRDEQSVTSSNQEQIKDECSKGEQSNIGDKNCQAEDKSVNMWPKKPKKDMQSNGSAMLMQHKMSKKQIVPQKEDKNCQENIHRRPMKSKMYADKICQAAKMSNKCYEAKAAQKSYAVSDQYRCVVTQTSSTYVYSRLCNDKNCQSTRCYSFKKKESSETNV